MRLTENEIRSAIRSMLLNEAEVPKKGMEMLNKLAGKPNDFKTLNLSKIITPYKQLGGIGLRKLKSAAEGATFSHGTHSAEQGSDDPHFIVTLNAGLSDIERKLKSPVSELKMTTPKEEKVCKAIVEALKVLKGKVVSFKSVNMGDFSPYLGVEAPIILLLGLGMLPTAGIIDAINKHKLNEKALNFGSYLMILRAGGRVAAGGVTKDATAIAAIVRMHGAGAASDPDKDGIPTYLDKTPQGEEEKSGGDAQTKKETEEVSKETVEIPSRAKDQVKMIQSIIDPDETNTKADGKWGSGTNRAWKSWVQSSETIEALKKMVAEKAALNESRLIRKGNIQSIIRYVMLNEIKADEVEEFIKNNAGNATKIAREFGFDDAKSTVAVTKFVQSVKGKDPKDPEGGYGSNSSGSKRKPKPKDISNSYNVEYDGKIYVYSDGEYKDPDGNVVEDQKFVAFLDRALEEPEEEDPVAEAKRMLKDKISTLKQAKRKGRDLSNHLLKKGDQKSPLKGSLKNISSLTGTEGGGSTVGWEVIQGKTNLINHLESIAGGTAESSDYVTSKNELLQIKNYVNRAVVKEMLKQTILGQNIINVTRALEYIETIKGK